MRGYSLAAAIGLSALLGPSQAGSRVLQVFSSKRHPIWTTLISVIFVAIGLLFVTIAPEMTALGLVIYGAGNGLRAIVRGLPPLALMSPTHYVLLMGRMARPSLIEQALPPPCRRLPVADLGRWRCACGTECAGRIERALGFNYQNTPRYFSVALAKRSREWVMDSSSCYKQDRNMHHGNDCALRCRTQHGHPFRSL